MWEWGNEIDYIHDEVATDKRNPTVNAYGPVYGVNISNDELAILDPMTHTATSLKIPLGDDDPSTVPSMSRRRLEGPRCVGDLWRRRDVAYRRRQRSEAGPASIPDSPESSCELTLASVQLFWQSESHQFGRVFAITNRYHNVLFAFVQVTHGWPRGSGFELDLPKCVA